MAPVMSNTAVYARWVLGDTIEAVSYTITDGADSVWTRGSGKELVLRAVRSQDDQTCYSHFTNVQINNEYLNKDTDYTSEAGSTLIHLNPGMLERMESGRYTVYVNFNDGRAETTLTISGDAGRNTDSPVTGDEDPVSRWLLILSVSGLLLTITAVVYMALRKRKQTPKQ